MRAKIPVYAIIRVDDHIDPTEFEHITVVKVLPTADAAEAETARLNALNAGKGCMYMWQYTRYYPDAP